MAGFSAVTNKIPAAYKFGAFGLMTIFPAVNEYRHLRASGSSRIGAAARTIFDATVMANPWMYGIAIGGAATRAAFGRINYNLRQAERAGQLFGRGTFTDSQAASDSRSALYQSAVAAQSSLRMTGRSWAGMEAAIFHKRYGA